MTGSYIEIETGALDADRQRMTVELQGVKNDLKRLIEEMQQLDAMWEGTAKLAFQIQFQSDCEMLKDICENLADYIDNMQTAGGEYRKCEDNIARLIAAIQI